MSDYKNEIEAVVLKYKLQPNAGLLQQIMELLVKYYFTYPGRGCDKDDAHKILVGLFVGKDDSPSALEKSLEKYNPVAEGNHKSFLGYFSGLYRKRQKDIYKKKYKLINDHQMLIDRTRQSTPTNMDAPGETDKDTLFLTSSEDHTSTVIHDILAEQIVPCILKAEKRISNKKYREPFLFSLTFAHSHTNKEVASLLGIDENTINSNMKRAREKFNDALQEEFSKRTDIDPRALIAICDGISVERMQLLQDSMETEMEKELFRLRFLLAYPRNDISAQGKYTMEQILVFEQHVIRMLFKIVKQAHDSLRHTAEGDPDMDYYATFLEQINGIPQPQRIRAAESGDIYSYFWTEVVKYMLPTPEQREYLQVKERLAALDSARITALCARLACTPAELSAALASPRQYRHLFTKLTTTLLGVPAYDPAKEAEEFMKMLEGKR